MLTYAIYGMCVHTSLQIIHCLYTASLPCIHCFSHVLMNHIISWRDGLNQIFWQWPGFLWHKNKGHSYFYLYRGWKKDSAHCSVSCKLQTIIAGQNVVTLTCNIISEIFTTIRRFYCYRLCCALHKEPFSAQEKSSVACNVIVIGH